MYKITKLIKDHLENDNIKTMVIENDDTDCIVFIYRGFHVKKIRVNIIIEKGEMPTVMAYLQDTCDIPPNKLIFTIALVNKFCAEYNWMQFWIGSNFKFKISAKSYVTEENAGVIAEELGRMCANAYDEIYPEIVVAILREEF